MKKYLLFYRVNNSKGYGRHEFDMYSNDFNKCMDMLGELQKGEWCLYHTDKESELEFLTYPLYEFCEDFNDSMFENTTWWSVVITKLD